MGLFDGTPWERPIRCERCGELEKDCRCPPPPPVAPARVPPGKQTARLVVERRKGRRSVTVVRGLKPQDNDLPALLTRLKAACGAGGTIKDDVIEIQGDQLEAIRALLGALGYRIT